MLVCYVYAFLHPHTHASVIYCLMARFLYDQYGNWFQFALHFLSFNPRSSLLYYCASLIYVNKFTYAYLTVHLCMAKSANATSKLCICDMLYHGNTYLNNRYGNWFQFPFYFLSLNAYIYYLYIHIYTFKVFFFTFRVFFWKSSLCF